MSAASGLHRRRLTVFLLLAKKGGRRCRGLLRDLRILKKRYLYFLFFASQVKNTGTKIVAMNVAAIMPPKTPVPIE